MIRMSISTGDAAYYTRMANKSGGEIYKQLYKKAKRVHNGAQRQVGVRTGGLRASITMKHKFLPGGQMFEIGSKHRIARLHHDGSRPHIITPNRARALRYSSSGRVRYSRAVMHPGTKPNRFLTDNLKLARL